VSEACFCRLAAVDMHTAQHLVSSCLTGDLARGRTIILVTHHLSLCLPAASHLVELDHGKILYHGTIPELEERGLLQRAIDLTEEEIQSPTKAQFLNLDGDQPGSFNANRQRDTGKLIEAEARAEGNVSFRSYLTYIRAAGVFAWILTLSVTLLTRAINIGNQVCITIRPFSISRY